MPNMNASSSGNSSGYGNMMSMPYNPGMMRGGPTTTQAPLVVIGGNSSQTAPPPLNPMHMGMQYPYHSPIPMQHPAMHSNQPIFLTPNGQSAMTTTINGQQYYVVMNNGSMPVGMGSPTMHQPPLMAPSTPSMASSYSHPHSMPYPYPHQMGRSANNIQARPNRSGNSSTVSRPAADVNVWGYAVVDPYHPTLHRVPLPPSVCSPTKGMLNYNADVQSSSTKPCSSTICMKFVSKSASSAVTCPLEENCPNFHVEKEFLETARQVSDPLCCAVHNDYYTREMMQCNCAPHLSRTTFTLVLEDRAEVEVLPPFIAFTVGLDHLPVRGMGTASTRIVNLRKQVCRLHLEGKCKWTKDCGHVHLCRDLYSHLSAFHYPSLMFLLNTESNVEKLKTTLLDGAPLLKFVRSISVLSLVSSLIQSRKFEALEALGSCGCFVTSEQRAAMQPETRQFFPDTQVIKIPEATISYFTPVVEPPAIVVPSMMEFSPDAGSHDKTAPEDDDLPIDLSNAVAMMPSFSPDNSTTSATQQ